MRDGREPRVLPRAGEAGEGGSCSARGWGWGWGWGAVACLCGGFWFSRVQSQGLGPGGGHFWLASCETVAPVNLCQFLKVWFSNQERTVKFDRRSFGLIHLDIVFIWMYSKNYISLYLSKEYTI